jgi:TP901 family phage tail tape measure protein
MAINLDVHGNTQPLEAAVQSAVNRIRRQPIKITVDDKGATQPLGNMKRAADEFSKSMEAANARIIAFGASMAIINGMADAFKGMVRNMVEVEKSLADINVVMGLSTQKLDAFSDGLFKVAKETGAAFKVAADAATEYARQGLNVEESLKRTKDALILTRLTGMDSAEAVKSLTAAMNTYGNQIKDTTQLVSKFAAVDVKFAVSAEDFADAISRTGAAAKGAGVNIDELIGLVTAAQQQTARGGKVIGNSFKTIFTRIGRTDTLNQLENLGIAVRDIEGKTLGAKKILTDLANTFDSLSEAQKAQIAQTVGGVFQINVLKAVLGDAAKQNGILANATQISAGATNEAIEKNEQLRNTMAAMATETGLAIKQVSAQIGEIMLAPGIEKVLNIVKSGAEGLSGLLGDGEGTGSKFANGFLKGLGNVISGPGLVVITAVFGKLFLKAASFAKESLTSLIGVTSEAQKQKAIQTSLVGLFGRSSELSKEMLRTDISRTEKEKIILGLLRAQVAEAKMLDSVAKSSAATLYSKGFGANLTPRRGRAYGHIPNFANPEREQAARGGYAAGSIRSMDMPGEGSIIYNSAEKVKTFSGLSQPAIMPPLSSKAGKNYQQAFGAVHGFDPYAAKGFVPNFNRGGAGVNPQGQIFNAINYAHMLTPETGSRTVLEKPATSIYGVPKAKLPKVRFKKYGVLQNASTRAENKKKNLVEQLYESVEKTAVRQGKMLADSFRIGTGTASLKSIKDSLNDGSSGAAGALTSVVGALFEAAISTKIKQVKGQSGGIEGVAQGIGGDFDLRNPTKEQKENLKLLFGGSWSKTNLADYKAQDSTSNAQSMADKILKEKLFRSGGKSTDPALAFAFGKRPGVDPRTQKRGLFAQGYIPNFANPLSDAIGREREAGVPVSQIRVGTHPALMNKGNPIGLGVTNTRDEPNGLKDVFGAKGYVPNYASSFLSDFSAGRDEYKSAAELQKELNIENKKLLKEQKELNQLKKSGKDVTKRLQGVEKQLTRNLQDQAYASKMAADSTKKMSVAARAGGLTQKAMNVNERFSNSAFGRSMSGFGGMGLMMGAPMLAGMLQQDGAAKGGLGYAAGGALQGAGTGAAMGMMFGPLGTAAGALIGGFVGLLGAVNESKEAIKEKAEAEQKQAQQIGQVLGEALYDKIDLNKLAGFTEGIGKIQNRIDRLSAIRRKTSEDINSRKTYEAVQSDQVNAKLLEVLKILPQDMQISGPGAQSGQVFSGTLKEYSSEINKAGPEQKKNILESIVESGKAKKQKEKDLQTQAREGVIRQLQMQKVILNAEAEAAKKIHTINLKYQNNILLMGQYEKLFGNVMSEQQKAQEKYNMSVYKAARAYDIAEQTIKDQQKMALIQKISKSTELQRVLLDSKQGQEMTPKEIENKLSGTSLTELRTKLKAIAKDEHSLRSMIVELLDVEEMKSTNQLTLAGQKLNMAKSEAAVQLHINTVLADRNEMLKDMNDRMKEFNSSADFERSMRGFSQQLESARFSAGGYRTKEETLAFNRSQFEKYGSANIEDKYDRNIMSQIGSLSREMQIPLNEDQQKAILKDSSAENMQNIYQSALKEEREKVSENNQDLSDERMRLENKIESNKGKLNAPDAAKAAQMSKEEVEALKNETANLESELEDVNNAYKENEQYLIKIKDSAEQINKKTQEGSEEIERQIRLKEKELGLQRGILKAKEEEYAKRTGEGAFSYGFGQEAKKMREQTKELNYQLGTVTATHFRDGLVTAMDAALDKSKDLGDALQGVAMGFLSALRNAFLQSAANQVVGAMGLSQGGNVRKYSKGGGVPAMVTNGEYVMSRRAVNKYGSNFMHSLNARGKTPNFSNGGGTMGLAEAFGQPAGGTMGLADAFAPQPEYSKISRPSMRQRMRKFFNNEKNMKLYQQEYEKARASSAMSKKQDLASFFGSGPKAPSQPSVDVKKIASFKKDMKKIPGIKSPGGNFAGKAPHGDVLAALKSGKDINKSAVQPGFFDNLFGGLFSVISAPFKMLGSIFSGFGGTQGKYNGGSVLKFAEGGGVPGSARAAGARERLSSRAHQYRKMSGFFYSGQAQSAGLRADVDEMQGILAEDRRRAQEAAARKAAKKQKRQALLQTVISAGLMYGLNNINFGGGGGGADSTPLSGDQGGGSSIMPVTEGGSGTMTSSMDITDAYLQRMPLSEQIKYNPGMFTQAELGAFGGRYFGGKINKYASGGHISGKSGIDQIPAMLSEGEYVIKASSARQLGKPMLDKINAGKFYDGGETSPMSETKGTSAGGNTNNINISINTAKGSEEKKQDGGAPAQDGEDRMKLLSERVKQQVLSVIVEEQRPGGLLS